MTLCEQWKLLNYTLLTKYGPAWHPTQSVRMEKKNKKVNSTGGPVGRSVQQRQ